MDSSTISLVSACTALAASIVGPIVTLAVAKRQFNATVLSANRQRWIETMRDQLSELISQVVAVMVIKKGRTDSWNEGFGAASNDPELLRRIERIVFVQWKIRLLLNPAKPDHETLAHEIEALLEGLKVQTVDQARTKAAVDHITQLSQAILTHEWERVKKGV